MKLWILSVFLLFFTISCSDFKEKTVIIGCYCGECGSTGCLTAFKIKGEKVYRLTNLKLTIFDNISYGDETLITDSLSMKILKIKQELTNEVYDLPSIIGYPDERDQCGIYLEVERFFYNKRINIDPEIQNGPQFLMRFVGDMKKMNLF